VEVVIHIQPYIEYYALDSQLACDHSKKGPKEGEDRKRPDADCGRKRTLVGYPSMSDLMGFCSFWSSQNSRVDSFGTIVTHERVAAMLVMLSH
jgi:hypothetical protein